MSLSTAQARHDAMTPDFHSSDDEKLLSEKAELLINAKDPKELFELFFSDDHYPLIRPHLTELVEDSKETLSSKIYLGVIGYEHFGFDTEWPEYLAKMNTIKNIVRHLPTDEVYSGDFLFVACALNKNQLSANQKETMLKIVKTILGLDSGSEYF